MQAEANILERIAQAYVARRGMRLFCVLGVLGAALLLFVLAGGFPPYAWRLLARALPQFPALEAAHGQTALLALLGLSLLSLTILFAWGALLWLCWRMLAYWRYERQELRNFAADAAQAYYLAEDEEVTYAAQSMENEAFSEDEDEGEAYREQVMSTNGLSRYERGRQRGVYTLAPLESEEPDDDSYQDIECLEEDEDEELGFYQDEEEALAPTYPTRPVRLMNAPDHPLAYDQQIIEHSGPGVHSDSIKHSSYGRVVPFPLASVSNAHTRPATGLYARVPLAGASSPTPEPAAHLTTQLIVSTGLDVGLARKGKPNEDSLLALQNTRMLRGSPCPVGLFVVADGMGGHANGQEASRLVIQSLSKTIVPSIIYGPTDDNYAELLAEGVHHANLEVYQRNRQRKVNMGTTIAAALVVDSTAYVVNAGDSRVYLYRSSSGLSQVTRDHSTVARLVETGLIQPDDIYTHPRRNEIYRSLGHHPSEDLDKFILALQPDDLLLLCSDGLWEMVRDAQIEQVIASTLSQPTQISAALVQAALEGGGKDNISVIVVYVKAVEAAQATWATG